ncbi:MAG: hypothetical protein NC302_11525 [Bacteroidales bacterium]|nr:hypothetical protein [Bacteroidales bacterium]MCM1416649.1 hypothetical protein [bacterium]MCM1424781.1 hypothetical protein [bacterium]
MKKLMTPKGSYGYLQNRKLYTVLRTLLYFALCAGLYTMGYLTTGSNKNLLTVVAILGCLPACKSLVNMILFLRASGCSESLHDALRAYDDKLTVFYDLYFTSYQKNYAISHMALKGGILCGITEDSACDCMEAQKHLEQMLLQEGIKHVTVQISSQADAYIDRLSRLAEMDAEEAENREGIVGLLNSISL